MADQATKLQIFDISNQKGKQGLSLIYQYAKPGFLGIKAQKAKIFVKNLITDKICIKLKTKRKEFPLSDFEPPLNYRITASHIKCRKVLTSRAICKQVLLSLEQLEQTSLQLLCKLVYFSVIGSI